MTFERTNAEKQHIFRRGGHPGREHRHRENHWRLYKIPLGRILGDVGFGHFNNAYAIYNLLLMISTAGLPVAMSKTISEANALDRRNQVNRVFRVALVTFVILGSISSLVMFVFAQPLANLQGDSLAAPAVRVMALSCFFVCTMSAYRGYAQGHSDMFPRRSPRCWRP